MSNVLKYSNEEALQYVRAQLANKFRMPCAVFYMWCAGKQEIWVHLPVCKVLTYSSPWENRGASEEEIAGFVNSVSSDIYKYCDIPKERWAEIRTAQLKGRSEA